MSDVGDDQKIEEVVLALSDLCSSCGGAGRRPESIYCPYDLEIWARRTLCHCCDECADQCESSAWDDLNIHEYSR